MADKRITILLLIILLFAGLLPAQQDQEQNLTAADTENQNYYLKMTEEGEEVFVQKLEWEFLEYVLRYEIELEKKVEDSFEKVDLYITQENFIEVSLTHGEYRYRIHVYNLLDKLDSSSVWIGFKILKAEVPNIQSFSPRNFYLDDTEDIEVIVNGINLKPDAVYYFLPEEGSLAGKVQGQVAEINNDLTRVKIYVNSDSFNEGRYVLHIKNPGGLEAQIPGLQVQYQDPSDIYISAGWAPGIVISPLFQAVGGKTGHLLSWNGKVSPIFLKRSFGYLGAELFGSFFSFSNEQENYSVSGFFSNATISFLYQYPVIKKKFFINGKLGAGVTFVHNVEYIYPNNAAYPAISTMFINAAAGVNAQYMITKNLCASIGLDYMLVFGNEAQVDRPLPGLIYPFLNIGWKF